MVDSLQRRKVHGTLVLVKSYCREGTAHQEKAGDAEMKGYHASRERMRPSRRGRGAGWRTQVLLAMLLGSGGGVAAVQIMHRRVTTSPTTLLGQPTAISHIHAPAAPYATAAALLAHTGLLSGHWFVRTRRGHTQLVVATPSSAQHQEARHAAP